MRNKLDPRLLEMVQQAQGREQTSVTTNTVVDVLVGLDAPLDDDARQDLAARGLHLRSEIADILTGSIRLADVPRLAGAARVLKIEASAPLYAEPSTEPLTGEG